MVNSFSDQGSNDDDTGKVSVVGIDMGWGATCYMFGVDSIPLPKICCLGNGLCIRSLLLLL